MSLPAKVVCLEGGLEVLDPSRFERILRDLDRLRPLQRAERIAIKLNLSAGTHASPDTGCNVSAAATGALVGLVRTVNERARISLCESDSMGFGFAFEKFSVLGYEQLVRGLDGVELWDLSRSRARVVRSSRSAGRAYPLPEVLLSADFVISLAKIKTHVTCGVTGGMKNHFGTLCDFDKSRYHPYLDRVIVDVNRAVRTDLSILDGNPAMEGDGPVLGRARPLGRVLFANNVVAGDATMARAMGVPLACVRYLRMAAEEGLGPVDGREIDVRWPGAGPEEWQFARPRARRRGLARMALGAQRAGQRLAAASSLLYLLDSATDVRRPARRNRVEAVSGKTTRG